MGLGLLWHRGNRCWTVWHSGCVTVRDPVWLVEQRRSVARLAQPRQSFYPILFRDINVRCAENEVSISCIRVSGSLLIWGQQKTNHQGKQRVRVEPPLPARVSAEHVATGGGERPRTASAVHICLGKSPLAARSARMGA
jgi:hypothetical protein